MGYKQTKEHVEKRMNASAWYRPTEAIKRRISETIKSKENYAEWNKKYRVDENVFDRIDTPEKAYWLGFIAADGGIGKNYLNITLQKRDKEHLEKFKKFLKSNLPIKLTKDKKYAKIFVSRKNIIKSLEKYGILPRKSKRLIFPNINTRYHPDFIRGYFDGDGCLSINVSRTGRKNLHFAIDSGTRSFLEKIQGILIENLGLSKTKIQHRKRYNGKTLNEGHVIDYTGNLQVPRIFNYLLQNSDVKLERKYKALMEI